MRVKEYGAHNSKVVVLLHGGGLSWWSYRDVAEHLQQDYHVVLPVLDGHADSDIPFISIEENAKRIIQYIDEHFGGSVDLLGGLSLGGQIAVEMLSQRPDICKAAILESALILPMPLTHALVKPSMDMSYGWISKEWFAKLQFRSLHIKQDLYEEYYRDTCKLAKADMTAFLQANSNYTVKNTLAHAKAKITIIAGANEPSIMIRSAKQLHQMLPDSTPAIKEELYHGEYSINHGMSYAEDVIQLLENV